MLVYVLCVTFLLSLYSYRADESELPPVALMEFIFIECILIDEACSMASRLYWRLFRFASKTMSITTRTAIATAPIAMPTTAPVLSRDERGPVVQVLVVETVTLNVVEVCCTPSRVTISHGQS